MVHSLRKFGKYILVAKVCLCSISGIYISLFASQNKGEQVRILSDSGKNFLRSKNPFLEGDERLKNKFADIIHLRWMYSKFVVKQGYQSMSFFFAPKLKGS